MSLENEIDKNLPKDFNNLFLGDQNKTDFGDFIETLDLVLGKNRFDILSSDTFEKCQKVQFDKKQNTPLFLFGGVFFILLGILIVLNGFPKIPNILIGAFFVIGGSALIRKGVILNKKPSTDQYNKLTENAADPVIARIVIDWVRWLIESDIPLYLEKGTTSQEPAVAISDAFRKAANMIMVLLGDERHRQALGINSHISEMPFLYDIEDQDRIFSPLIYELAKTPQYEKFREALQPTPEKSKTSSAEDSKNEPAEDSQNENKSNQKPEPEPETKTEPELEPKQRPLADDDKSKRKRQRIESAKKRDTYYKKSTPKAHDYLHLQALLDRLDMMKLFVDYSETDEFWEFIVKGNKTRELWTKVFIYIYKNWSKWQAYKHLPSTKSKFIKTLFGPDYLNIEQGNPDRRRFRLGKHREMSNFIIECYAIPVSELGKDPQRDLFQGKIQN